MLGARQRDPKPDSCSDSAGWVIKMFINVKIYTASRATLQTSVSNGYQGWIEWVSHV